MLLGRDSIGSKTKQTTLEDCKNYVKGVGGQFASYTPHSADCYAYKGPAVGNDQGTVMCYIKQTPTPTPKPN